MKRPSVGNLGKGLNAKPTGSTTPPRAEKKAEAPPAPAEPKLNPRQILEAKKAAEKAAEAMPMKKKAPPAKGSRSATPTKGR